MKSVSAGSRSRGRFHEVGAVDVGNEPEGHRPVAVMLERLVGHHRPEVGAADADVDHVADAFAGVALPCAAPDPVGEVGHLVQHGVNLGHHVLAVDDDGRRSRRAQGHVQDGAVFRDVDLVAPEHGVDALAQAAFLGQLQEELEGFVRDAILRVIEKDARGLSRQTLAAVGILREELAEMHVPDSSCGGRRAPSTPGVSSAMSSLSVMVVLLSMPSGRCESLAEGRVADHRVSPTFGTLQGTRRRCRRAGSRGAPSSASWRFLRR